MKPELDRETDALLRDHAQRGGARDGLASVVGAAGSSAHLDADELNAFAENAAPEAARSRYLSHLADCDDCRRTATRLALDANATPARDEPDVLREKTVAGSWRERLAALFAPGAWRYAMPVVALLGVGVVALVLMKQVPRENQMAARQEEGQLARSTEADQQHATSIAQPESAATPSQPQTYVGNDAPAASSREVVRSDTPAAANQAEAKAGGAVTPASPGVAPPGEGASATAGALQPQAAQRRVEDLPPPAASVPAPAMAPAPQPKLQDNVAAEKEEPKSVRDEEVAERTNAQMKSRRAAPKRGEPTGSTTTQTRALNRVALNPDDASSADRSGGARARPSESRAGDDREKRDSESGDNSSAETRKVAGRKFRRQGDSWIDTAYNSSQATTVVRRNSEQYRALVADEAEIGRIAGALGGEVVVVWKGRAYRIKP